MFPFMELTKPSCVIHGEHIRYLFTASLPTCQFAWEFAISKNLKCELMLGLNLVTTEIFTFFSRIIFPSNASLDCNLKGAPREVL